MSDSYKYWEDKLKKDSNSASPQIVHSGSPTISQQREEEEIITTDEPIDLELAPNEADNIIVVGPTSSGKTSLINHIMRKNLKYFKAVFVFSKSGKYAMKQNYPYLNERFLFGTDNMVKNLAKISNAQQNLLIKYKQNPLSVRKVAVVLDDIASINFTVGRDAKFYDDFIALARQRQIVFIVIVQKLTLVSPTIRENCQNIFVTKASRAYMKMLWECCGNELTLQEFAMLIIKYCNRRPFHCIWFKTDSYDEKCYKIIKQLMPNPWKITMEVVKNKPIPENRSRKPIRHNRR